MGDILEGSLLEACPVISTAPTHSTTTEGEEDVNHEAEQSHGSGEVMEEGEEGQDGEVSMMEGQQVQDHASSSDEDQDDDEDDEDVDIDVDIDSSENGDDTLSSVDDEEIDQLLEEGLPVSKRVKSKKRLEGGEGGGGRNELEYNEKQIIVLEERSKNTLEVLPGGWIEVRHSSGMPLYLHRKTRVCSLAKPYFLGPGSARRHSIPLSAIPCLAYRRQLDQEINVVNGFPDMESSTTPETLGNGTMEIDATEALCGKRRFSEEEMGVIIPNKQLKKELDKLTGDGDDLLTSCPVSHSTNVVASGTSEVSLEVPIQSPDRQSLNASQETTTSAEPSYSVILSQEQGSPSLETPPSVDSSTPIDSVSSVAVQGNEAIMPVAKVATAKENHSMHSISPEDLREYCKSVFKFKIVTCKRFKTWSARRRHTKEQKRIQLQRPTMPDGVKLISFPVHNNGPPEAGKMNKEYIMNPQGKSSVCILHEYVQHALRKQPTYIFRELENASTPYSATVVINGMQYGTGFGSSKKQAKSDAAKTALEVLIPQMKDQLNGTKSDPSTDFDVLPFFEPFGLLDSGISKICKNFSEPPPYGLLLTCLQRNFGQDTCNSVKFEMISPGPQSNKFQMVVGEHSVEVQAPNKREGKQLASQQLLAKLHPNIKNFGSFVKLYGNNSIKSVKEKKQEEQQITTLQSKASANSPNWAILSKLKMEMRKLQEETPKLSAGIRPWPSNVKDKQDSPTSRPVDPKEEEMPKCKKLLGEISIGDTNVTS